MLFMKIFNKPFVIGVLLLLGIGTALGQTPNERVARIQADENYQKALAFIDEDYPLFVEELIELTEIPAPPFMESERGAVYREKLQELGLESVETDAVGNVMGIRPGGEGPLLVVAAHLDTVFPENTDVRVRREGTRLSAPGIGDDTAGLALLLAVIRAMDAAGIQTAGDILFVGDVGEEGPGDLRGMKHLFLEGPYSNQIEGFVSVEGGRQVDITNAALGSKRYRVTFSGPGGHSYNAFGLVSPAFAMGNAIRKLSALEVSEDPKTTFNVGVIGGGTSVNSIPFESWMEVDIRSEEREQLEDVAETFLELMYEAVAEENETRSTGQGKIELRVDVIGDRPLGEISLDTPLVENTAASFRAFGIEPTYSRSSTDSNIPISLGIPAVTIDRGGMGGRSHSLDEWVDVEKPGTVKGIQVVLTTILTISGLDETVSTD
jgi:tripeptide aminopeptidase